MKPKDRGLELKQDLAFQRREWRVQRMGWWVLAAFVVAASLGLFGGGPLSAAQAGVPGAPLWIEYERFVRVGAPTRISLHAGVAASSNGIRLRIRRSYFEALKIERMVPEPAAVAVGESDVTMRFDSVASGSPFFTVILDVEPLRAGRHQAAFDVDGAGGVSFAQLAYF